MAYTVSIRPLTGFGKAENPYFRVIFGSLIQSFRKSGALWISAFFFAAGTAAQAGRLDGDSAAEYILPFSSAKKVKVTQGYNGRYSHQGICAIDFRLKEGTAVVASRGGRVLRTKDDSDRGGHDQRFIDDANFISIRHSDGTIGFYCHLRKSGVVVKAGDEVKQGELIGYSGNTGYSSGPHLHFSVLREDRDGLVTIPVSFQVEDNKRTHLQEGERYSARPLSKRPAAVGGARGH